MPPNALPPLPTAIDDYALGEYTGLFCIVQIDPLATLSPVLSTPSAPATDDYYEERQQLTALGEKSRRYLAFIRQAMGDGKVHLCLVHDAQPTLPAVAGEDGIEPDMCVPIWPNVGDGTRVPLRGTNLNLLPRSKNNHNKTEEDGDEARGWWAHTIMDVEVVVDRLDVRGFRRAIAPAFGEREMARFDLLQDEDKERERANWELFAKQNASSVALDRQDSNADFDDEDDEDEDDEAPFDDLDVSLEDGIEGDRRNWRLSTLISGITFDPDTHSSTSSAPEGLSSEPPTPTPAVQFFDPNYTMASYAPAPAPVVMNTRPYSIASTDSTFSFKSIATLSSQDSNSPEIPIFRKESLSSSSSSNLEAPPIPDTGSRRPSAVNTDTVFKLSVDPPSPTAITDLSGPTRVNTNALRHQASTATFSNWAKGSSSEGEVGEGNVNGAAKQRQCPTRVKVWLNVRGAIEQHGAADPRLFFDELKTLRRMEKEADIKYLRELRKVNADRVNAWKSQLIQTLPPTTTTTTKSFKSCSPSAASSVVHISATTYGDYKLPANYLANASQKSLPHLPGHLGCPFADEPYHYLRNCEMCELQKGGGGEGKQGKNLKSLRRKSLKPFKTLWSRMKSQSNIKA